MPVCVSSENRMGARVIVDRLQDYRLPHVVMSALDSSPEERWLGWALDLVWRRRMADNMGRAVARWEVSDG
jgi:hypothetical protein